MINNENLIPSIMNLVIEVAVKSGLMKMIEIENTKTINIAYRNMKYV